MNDSDPPPKASSSVSTIVKRVVKYGLAGALVSGLAAGIMFGTGPTSAGGNHSWALIMVPTFAIIGGLMGALYGLLLSVYRHFRK